MSSERAAVEKMLGADAWLLTYLTDKEVHGIATVARVVEEERTRDGAQALIEL